MAETRQQIKQRLQVAGLWQDYVAMRQKLGKDGMTPAQARTAALHQIETRPRADAEQPAPNTDTPTYPIDKPEQTPAEQPDVDFGGQIVPSRDAVEWVSENIEKASVRRGDAPSGLAWGLLAWVRRTPANEATFWGSIFPKLLPTGAALKGKQEKAEEEVPIDEGTERCLELCEQLIRDAVEASKR
jgi:hypothetical protein